MMTRPDVLEERGRDGTPVPASAGRGDPHGEIADKCELELTFGRALLPSFGPIPAGMTSSAYLNALCREGWRHGMRGMPHGRRTLSAGKRPERLAYELNCYREDGLQRLFPHRVGLYPFCP